MRALAIALCIFFVTESALSAQRQSQALLISNVATWDGSGNEIRNDQFILIIDGEITAVGPQKPTAPAGTKVADGSGHIALGRIEPGQKADFVLLDAEDRFDDLTHGPREAEDPDHMPLRALEAGSDKASIYVGGIISVDGLDTVQDDDSEQQVGDLTEFRGGELTAARFVIGGHLGQERPVEYFMDWGYNGFEQGFDIVDDDEYTLYNLELTLPNLRIGRLTFGRMKAPWALSRNWGGAYLPTAVRQAPINALTKSRDDGVRLTNTAFDKRMTWGVGVFNDWLTNGTSRSDTNTYVVGRVTGLAIDDRENDHLLQVGLGVRLSDFVEDTIRFKAGPGVPSVPKFLDTGDIPTDGARWLSGEIAWRRNNFMINAEHVRTELDSPTIGSPTFSGTYAWLEWTMTGESRPWNFDNALPGRPQPSRDFTKGGKGLWSLSFAVNDTDLNEGLVNGGDMQQAMIGVNWYPQKSFRWGLAYGRTWLDRDGIDGTTDFLHLFIHLSNL